MTDAGVQESMNFVTGFVVTKFFVTNKAVTDFSWFFKYLYMQHLKSLREQLGLSQQELALLAGCKRAQLAMAETNRRNTPSELKPFLAVLEGVSPAPKSKVARAVHPTAVDPVSLAKITRVAKVKLTGYELRISEWERKIETTEKLVTTTTMLSNTDNLSEFHRLPITVLHRQAQARLLKYKKRWLHCRFKIVSLQAIIREADALSSI